MGTLKKKQAELAAAGWPSRRLKGKAEPFPPEMRLWSVADVARWLDTLSLGQYKDAFREKGRRRLLAGVTRGGPGAGAGHGAQVTCGRSSWDGTSCDL